MTEDFDKPQIPDAVFTTLLGSIPPTDPAIIKRMQEQWIEDKHYAEIGHVAANWSYFESVVDFCSIRLSEVHKTVGIIFTSQISGIVRKMDAYISLARLRSLPTGMVDDLCKFADASRGLSERRNRIVHDVWYFNHPSAPQRVEASARRLLKFAVIPVTTQELTDFAAEIETHRARFEDLDLMVAAAPIKAENKS